MQIRSIMIINTRTEVLKNSNTTHFNQLKAGDMKTTFFVCLGMVICLNFVSIAGTLGGTECLTPRVSRLESSVFRLASGISNLIFAPC